MRRVFGTLGLDRRPTEGIHGLAGRLLALDLRIWLGFGEDTSVARPGTVWESAYESGWARLGVMSVRIATFSVENLFDRAAAFDQSEAVAQSVLSRAAELNRLFEFANYTELRK